MCEKFSFQGFQGKVFITKIIIHIYTKIYWEFIIIHIQTDDVTSQFFFILFFYKRVDKKINRRKDFHFLIVVVVYFVGIVLHLDEILFFLW